MSGESNMIETYDAVIMGGGAAGLTLAIQLKQARPEISLLVIEPQEHPVPEAAYKVGESTVEIGARYLRDVLGLREHLATRQLEKFGLRMFFTAEGNEDITRRPEIGAEAMTPYEISSFQIDRGRLENHLATGLTDRGVDLVHGKVEDAELRPGKAHLVSITRNDGAAYRVEARWVLDATGRHSLLRRKLGLSKDVEHRAGAVWFRIGHPLDIDGWSDDPAWHERVSSGRRELSTNHLMGPGYWVWLIRLASDAISIGIVADPALHPFERMNRFERALEWLREYEPQCARAVTEHRDKLQDFKVLRNYPYGVEQVFSADRWALTGEAGMFVDPLYSPGFDLIAIGNGLITDLVTRDLAGENIARLAAVHDRVHLTVAEGFFKIYTRQYAVMGNARVMQAKVVFDTAVYWAVPALLYFQDRLRLLADDPPMIGLLARFQAVTGHVQRFFREWAAVDRSRPTVSYTGLHQFDFMKRLHFGLAKPLTDAEFAATFAGNVRLVERIAGRLVKTVIEEGASADADEQMRARVGLWHRDSNLMSLVTAYEQDHAAGIVDAEWNPAGPVRS
ncbi:MAG: tryptophan 7-halogenase [Actinomycetota bacterium]|nr:tryptophan 7-halogenase [Actinomycetota bacterium]